MIARTAHFSPPVAPYAILLIALTVSQDIDTTKPFETVKVVL